MKIVISSGHAKLVRGASDIIDEVDEARRVVNRVAEYLATAGVGVEVFHDDTSTTQSSNLERIVDFHNAQTRDLDVSVHFNAYEHTANPMGCEVLYVTQAALAGNVADAICEIAGFKNRGAKKRTDLAFLNNTEMPSILIETCFVDSEKDVDLYRINFDGLCAAIASATSGHEISSGTPLPPAATTPPPETTKPEIPVITISVRPAGSAQVIVYDAAD